MMSADEFDQILAKIHHCTASLQISCAWEYSIAKNAPEIIQVLNKYSDIPKIKILTHGNTLTEQMAEAIVSSPLKQYIFSIGESNKETYERVRGGKFEKVIDNIRNLDLLKKKRGSTYPIIGVNLTIIRSTLFELLDFLDLASKIGVQQIVGRHLILNEGLENDSEVIRDFKEANSILDAAEHKARSYGMSFDIPKFVTKKEPKYCQMPWNSLYISSNGDVAVCPRIHIYEKIGNLLESDLKEVETSQNLQKFREQFKNKKFDNPVCGVCEENKEHEIPINQGF